MSIPADHRVGKVESPSILRLEFAENPDRHVVLERVVRKEYDEYYDEREHRHFGNFVVVTETRRNGCDCEGEGNQ